MSGSLYLTPRQLAERWSCSPRHIRRLCASGDLPAMRLGLESWRISTAAVEAYEAARTSAPAPMPAAPKSKEVQQRATAAAGVSLPDGYEPVFPALWASGSPATKKAALTGQ